MRSFKQKVDEEETFRVLIPGNPNHDRCNNRISTAKYTLLTFVPVSVLEQFRRVANLYFLIVGFIMAIGYYTDAYESAISPWSTLGPLCFVISVSLLQEGLADLGRHRSDSQTNNHRCVVMSRAEDVSSDEKRQRDETVMGGRDVKVGLDKPFYAQTMTPRPSSKRSVTKIAFESIKRMDIRQGHIVLIRNRDMVPADLILLASSSDNGSAYIETSSIDGETNLKLRTSPQLPKDIKDQFRRIQTSRSVGDDTDDEDVMARESLEQATKRICRLSALAFPEGISALENEVGKRFDDIEEEEEVAKEVRSPKRRPRLVEMGRLASKKMVQHVEDRLAAASETQIPMEDEFETNTRYVAALKSEPPNASINTFGGVLVLPPVELGGPSVEIALNADNMLLRGAVLRNTEWAIGISCFTGGDTKLVQNSFETPSKFSQLDRLMNRTVFMILGVMVACISILSTLSVYANNRLFEKLWYVGYSDDPTKKWPYLPDLDSPEWLTSPSNWFQIFFLYVTLLNNFVPLSLYVTVEVVTAALRLFINLDIDMYDPKTDTRTVARSTTVTDLGQVQYIFSDKTGTLTQNVMRFKRCSVDGLVFGAPVLKMKPEDFGRKESDGAGAGHAFHPLRKLLVGKIGMTTATPGLEGLGGMQTLGPSSESKCLTFNAEMFLRVMSLCHTVVVEKDYDANKGVIDASKSIPSNGSYSEDGDTKHSGHFQSAVQGLFRFNPLRKHDEKFDFEEMEEGPIRGRTGSVESVNPAEAEAGKGKDGAPHGFAYQAESPDEGALVEASSLKFDFQVAGRDSDGIRLSCMLPSLLEDEKIIAGLKDGSITAKNLAAKTASVSGTISKGGEPITPLTLAAPRKEVWQILAVNKFDSTRKRMSVLVRSPENLGSIPILFCKGADTAMLDPKVLENSEFLMTGEEDAEEIAKRSMGGSQDEEEDWERSAILGLQSHLGEFAKEGLRTLVLGLRILSEEEATEWLDEYKAAATAIKNREEKLAAAAGHIERKLHIVGATAIEDKLQDGVPETIAKLGRAGIKLWVLTGDKRETAKEIGYATKVLTQKMRPGMLEVAAGPELEVRTKMAMEFLRLIKYAKLPEYQKTVIGENEKQRLERLFFNLGKCRRSVGRSLRRFYHKYIKIIWLCCFGGVPEPDPAIVEIEKEESNEKHLLMVTERRRNVRRRAERIVNDYLDSGAGKANRKPRQKKGQGEFSNADLAMDESGASDVFTRAQSAKMVLDNRRSRGDIPGSDIRDLTLANVTAHEATSGEMPLVDEDILSMKSHIPADGEDGKEDYDRMKRTLLERVFAVDKAVRHGRLMKHMTKEKLISINESSPLEQPISNDDLPPGIEGPRALVIEGHALERLLGDSELEELLFAVANTCDSVIACRVSPAQKAQLVQLVRRYVVPEPVTLAIGDGANDVGMIQEAHVGVGISGKEGQQAVNASDFAIAQFRFLQELVLIHGRWDFFRQSAVVLFSFYKNAVMAGILILYTPQNVYSGTPLLDQWMIGMLNFVAATPIGALGLFDRCLDKDYIKAHPEVYGPSRRNELITNRTRLRWVVMVFVHVYSLYYLTVPALADGGGNTSAFTGLMYNEDIDRPGEGEGGDLKSVGLVTYSCMVVLLCYKVLFESRSIIVGTPPPFTCQKNKGEGFLNRAAYSWIANAYLSIGFYLLVIYVYQIVGRAGASDFSPFVLTTYHVLHTRSISWMMIILTPIAGMAFDVAGKVYSNLFYPTQTQIHVEIFAKGKEGPATNSWGCRKRSRPNHGIIHKQGAAAGEAQLFSAGQSA